MAALFVWLWIVGGFPAAILGEVVQAESPRIRRAGRISSGGSIAQICDACSGTCDRLKGLTTQRVRGPLRTLARARTPVAGGQGYVVSALALSWSYSACVIAPDAKSSLPLAISSVAEPDDATDRT